MSRGEPSSGHRRPRARPGGAIIAGLALAALGLALAPWIAAQARAASVLAITLEAPVLSAVVTRLTGSPTSGERTIAGTPATLVRPAGEGPWPAIVFLNGATPRGRRHPTVQRLARALARSGFVVLVPELPGLREGRLSERTLAATLAVARAAARSADARDGRIGLVGVSTGATLGLLAAERPELAERVSIVAGIAPYADIRNVLRIATTATYRERGRTLRFEAEPFLLLVVARSLVDALPTGPDRDLLATAVERVEQGEDRLTAVGGPAAVQALGGEAHAVAALLVNRDPDRFDALYEALSPAVRERLELLSPLAGSERLQAPVELASGPSDKYFPVSESRALARIAPDHRVTVTDALDHADPAPSLDDLPGLARLDGFVVRSLRAAVRGR